MRGAEMSPDKWRKFAPEEAREMYAVLTEEGVVREDASPDVRDSFIRHFANPFLSDFHRLGYPEGTLGAFVDFNVDKRTGIPYVSCGHAPVGCEHDEIVSRVNVQLGRFRAERVPAPNATMSET